jgi:hypothetical protein
MGMIRALVIVLALFMGACSHSDDDNGPILPGDGEDRIFNQPAVENTGNAATNKAFKYYNTNKKTNQRAWRIKAKGPSFGKRLLITFSSGARIIIPNSSRRCTGFGGITFRPGIGSISSGTGTSHGGVYIYGPKGDKSTTLTIQRI